MKTNKLNNVLTHVEAGVRTVPMAIGGCVMTCIAPIISTFAIAVEASENTGKEFEKNVRIINSRKHNKHQKR